MECDLDDRNPIEGNFGQGKVKNGIERIKARHKDTSEFWVAMKLVVMSVARLGKEAPYFLLRSIFSLIVELIGRIIMGIKMVRQPAFLFPVYIFRLIQ